MAGKGGKGLVAGKTMAAAVATKEKSKKQPISRSACAGLQLTDEEERAVEPFRENVDLILVNLCCITTKELGTVMRSLGKKSD
ncbi:hypothetical protein CASFOL_031888 [Castilleja foliolosa]|uniref:Uncharacterized protein n=1 Tax=Castilleja foliolosa TaxID=1961234 RepID=A0ABD3C2P1_9LAMI